MPFKYNPSQRNQIKNPLSLIEIGHATISPTDC